MNKVIRNLILPTFALGMALFALYHLLYAEEKRPPLAPPAAPPRAVAGKSIAGVGMVEPLSENISVGSAQNGIALEVFFTADRVGERVNKGEPLLRVDDRTLKAQLAVQRANLRVAVAELQRLKLQPRVEDIPPLEAKVKAAAARKADMEVRYQRVAQVTSQAVPPDEIAQRRYAMEVATHELEQARSELDKAKAGAWGPDLAVAQTNVEVANANIAATEIEIDRCLVRAPIDGELLQVNVRIGEFVSGSAAKALFVLGDLQSRRVRVDIDEEDIPRFRNGQRAVAYSRGNTSERFPLRLVRIEPLVVPKKMLSGENTERVDTRVLQAVYEIESPDAKVYVGQQLDVFIELPDAS
jgi:multidrug resistance efflux pump